MIDRVGTNDADEWCLSQNGTSSVCPGGTSKHFASDLRSLTSGYMQLPSVKKTYLMIPPPYAHLQAVPTPVSIQQQKCPPPASSCGETAPFNGTSPSDGQGEPEKEHAKACVINCILPVVVPAVAKALQLPAPLDLLSLLGFPGHVNITAMPGLHPSCEGYTTIGRYIAKELFPQAGGEAGDAPAAPPRFSNVFQRHMVLQRDAAVKVWGFASGSGPQLVVTLCKSDEQGECKAEGSLTRTVAPAADGSWSAVFPPQHGSTTPMLLKVGEDGRREDAQKLEDIVFGDVLLFSGQSNIDTSQPYAFSDYNPHAARPERNLRPALCGAHS